MAMTDLSGSPDQRYFGQEALVFSIDCGTTQCEESFYFQDEHVYSSTVSDTLHNTVYLLNGMVSL